MSTRARPRTPPRRRGPDVAPARRTPPPRRRGPAVAPARWTPAPRRRGRDANARRRLATVRAAMVLAFAVLGARLVQVQGLSAERYAAFGEQQRVRAVDLPANRGSIFDRHGRDLALTVRQSTVIANPRLVTDPLAAAQALAPVLGQEPAEVQTRLTRDQAFVYLARKVDDAVAERVKALGVPGVALIEEPERFLPAGDLAEPLLGRVGIDNNGLSGLEMQYEGRLAGRPGRMVVERDPRGRDIVGGVRRLDPSARGDDLVLTIDRALQWETERALAAAVVGHGAKGGTAIVMRTRTGEVLALANLAAGPPGRPPTQSPKNLALTNVFEPGSVNKVITIAAALEEGLIRPEDTFAVPSTIKVADHVFSEHDPHPLARWSVTDIMANSSNVGSIMIGQRLGKQRVDRYLRAFGFGARTGLGFPGESPGILLDPGRWSGTSLATMSIGQGVAVTAMQMLGAYNTVANAGTWVAPKLVKVSVDTEGRRRATSPAERRRVLSARTAKQATAMLTEVVRVGTGTKAAIDGYTVAGKTGTARKPLEGVRGYKTGAYVASFAGFVPAERPELTAIVVLDEPTPIFGGLVAAPVFAEVARYGLRQLQVPPPPPGSDPPALAEVPKASPDTAKEVGPGAGAPVGEPPSPGTPGPGAPATGATTLPPSPPPRPNP